MPQVQSSRVSRFLYGALPALPVVVGGMIVSWQSETNLYSIIIGIVLVFCGIGSGLFLWHRHAKELAGINSRWAADQNSKIDAIAAYTNELERLLLTVSPILSQHVTVSREHTEQEIISLTNRFSSMVNGLQQIVDNTANTLNGQDYHLDSVINTSTDLLQPVLESIKRIQQVDQTVTSALQKLSEHLVELNPISTDLRNLTGQINLLSGNVANEASLDVRHDQGVTVVDGHVRKLANQSFQIEQRLNNKTNELIAELSEAMTASENALQVGGLTLLLAETNFSQALSVLNGALTHYRDDAEALRNNAGQIRGEINNVLVALQFQDRVSQILTQVESNLLNLQKTIEKIQRQGSKRDGNMLQVDEAVEHIEESYKSVSTRPNHESDSSDDLTFF